MRLAQNHFSVPSVLPSSPVARYVNSVSVNSACDKIHRARCATSRGTQISQLFASPNRGFPKISSAGRPSRLKSVTITCPEETSEKVATTCQSKFEVDGIGFV